MKKIRSWSAPRLTAVIAALTLVACGAATTGTGTQDSPLEGEPGATPPGDDGAQSPAHPGAPGGEIGQPEACQQAFPRDTVGKECVVTHGGLCFEDNETACACAGCPTDAVGVTCIIAESYPAQAFCERPAPTDPDPSVDPDCAVSDDSDGPQTDCGGGNGSSDTPSSTPGHGSDQGGGVDGSPAANCEPGFAPNSDEGVCNATYAGMCFETDADACACAGCPIDSPAGCLVMESYPTQIRCP